MTSRDALTREDQPDPITVFRLPDRRLGSLDSLPTDPNAYRAAVFSPDGKRLACAIHDAEPGTATPHRLVLVRMDDLGRDRTLLQFGGWAGLNYSFSPDGGSIAIQIEYPAPEGGNRDPRREVRIIPTAR